MSAKRTHLQEARAADRVDLAISLTEAVMIPALFANSTAVLGDLHRRAVCLIVATRTTLMSPYPGL